MNLEFASKAAELIYYQTSFDLSSEEGVAWNEIPVHLGIRPENSEVENPEGEPDYFYRLKTEGYAVFCLAKDTPEKKCFHRYIITYQPSLWDRYTVAREWGRIGSEKFQRQTEHFHNSRSALARVDRLIKTRLKRGYQLTSAA